MVKVNSNFENLKNIHKKGPKKLPIGVKCTWVYQYLSLSELINHISKLSSNERNGLI